MSHFILQITKMAETEPTTLLLPLFFLLPLIFFILKQLKSPKYRVPLPPGPYQWPILGNLLQVGKNPHFTLTKLAQTYGPLMSVKLGTQLVVIGSSHAAAMEILKTHDRNLSARYVPHVAPAKPVDKNGKSVGWVVECNSQWKQLRTICRTELFSNRSVEAQASIREGKAVKMVRFVKGMEGKVVNIKDVAFAAVCCMLSTIFLSEDVVRLEEESVEGSFCEVVGCIMQVASARNVSDYWPVLSGFDLQGLRKRSLDLCARACALWEPILKKRREMRKNKKNIGDDYETQQDFLDAMINNGSSDEQINTMIMELLTAGTDTSSSTVEWTLAELIKNPELMKKAKEELAREIKLGDEVKETHLPRLSFIQACVKETLRLHCPVPFLLPHRAVETCEVMNYTIPKDTKVLVNIWSIGRDPKYWEDPLEYKPERFLKSKLDFKGNDFEYLPFGAGRRICPGLPMAARHVPLILASLLHFFDWSLPEGCDRDSIDMDLKFSLTTMKQQPLLLVPKLRK